MSEELDVWDSLMVRACKVRTPSLVRLRKVFARRCLLELCYVEDRYLADYLLGLIEKYELTTLSRFIFEMDPEQLKYCRAPKGCVVDEKGVATSQIERIITRAVSIIRLTRVDKLPGLRSPSRFKK